jgi:competence protein ComEC
MGVTLAAWSMGIMLAVLLSPLPLWLALIAGLALSIGLINRHLAPLAGVALLALLLGAGRGALATPVQLPPGISGQVVTVSGWVDDDPVDHKTSRRVTVRLDHLVTDDGDMSSDLGIEAVVYGMTPVHYGDLVLLTGTLQEAPRFDQFDYRAYLAEQGIAGVMPSARLVRATLHSGEPLHTMLFSLRHAVVDAVERGLPEPRRPCCSASSSAIARHCHRCSSST